MSENTEGQSQMDNPEKLATYDTQDEDKQNKKIEVLWCWDMMVYSMSLTLTLTFRYETLSVSHTYHESKYETRI